ncbi:hydroxysqualene dehydroxylase HpnE [Acidovorax lacteus]|uniref:Hydroxysqualene dehydroxylase HpnE n=1 Tax=Acidovorax lacteus TaxID=1924988 RepID=A0ABP8LHG1_9BURK
MHSASSTSGATAPRVAIVGGGWAGMAAAMHWHGQGAQITVYEAARTLGGRARSVPARLPDGRAVMLDNGQHILVGAYRDCLALMRTVGLAPERLLLRMPLALQYPDRSGLRMPDLPPPWDALAGIAQARGWTWGERLALLQTAARWRLQGFCCAPEVTVRQLCQRLPRRLIDEFIDPLCVSALNTPAAEASGAVFLRVLQDSLFAGRGGSHLLLPRTDLGRLWPEAAADWLRARGCNVHLGRRVQGLAQRPAGGWTLLGVEGETGAAPPSYDTVVMACPSWETSRLVAGASGLGAGDLQAAAHWCARADALRFEAITTVYLWEPGVRLPLPMLSLRHSTQEPAHFAFDRGQLDGPSGLMAFVISASSTDRGLLETQVLAQARRALGMFGVNRPQVVQTIVEKRATFACTPALARPPRQILPGLTACGDYVDGPYPATLEGAVRSALAP